MTEWLKRVVTRPLLGKLAKEDSELLRVSGLYVVAKPAHFQRKSANSWDQYDTIPAVKANARSIFHAIPFLRKMVILSTTVSGYRDRSVQHELSKKLGGPTGCFLYRVSAKKEGAEAARKFFAKLGYRVIDLTVKYSWDKPEAPKPAPVPKKDKPAGWVCLSEAVDKTGSFHTAYAKRDKYDPATHFSVPRKRITNPEFYVKHPKIDYEGNSMWPLSHDHSNLIAATYGSVGCVALDGYEVRALKKLGVPSHEEWVKAKVIAYVKDNPRIEEFWANDISRIEMDMEYHARLLSKLLWETPELRAEFGLVNNLNKPDTAYMEMFATLWKERLTDPDEDKEIKDLMIKFRGIKIHPRNTDLIKKLNQNQLLGLLSEQTLRRFILGTDKLKKAKTIEILVKTING